MIRQAEAFIVTPQIGMMQVDEKGNPVTPAPRPFVMVFVQSRSASIKWDSAWLGNQPLPVTQQPITQTVEMGVDASTGESILIKQQEGWFLFKLEIQPASLKSEKRENSIRIRGYYKNKPIYTDITTVRQLTDPDAQ